MFEKILEQVQHVFLSISIDPTINVKWQMAEI